MCVNHQYGGYKQPLSDLLAMSHASESNCSVLRQSRLDHLAAYAVGCMEVRRLL